MKVLVASLVWSTLTMSQAWSAQALDKLLACRPMPDPAARLECFDSAADSALKAKQGNAAPTESKPLKESKTPTVESRIAQISQPVAGRADFTLENGQVWRQMDSDSARSAKVGDRVVVSKASFLSAYWLKVEGGHAWRVTLVR